MTSSTVDEHFTAAATTVDWKDCLRILTYAPTVQHFKLKLFKNEDSFRQTPFHLPNRGVGYLTTNSFRRLMLY